MPNKPPQSSKTIGIRFNADEQTVLKALAKKTSLTVSGVVHLAVAEMAERRGVE